MKLKFFISIFAILFASSFSSFASFPVENIANNNASQTTLVQQTNSNNPTALTSPAVAGSGKSQLIALLLCLFIGGIGIHRFYLGYTWQGVVQLLTLGGLGVWALIDLIRIITGDLQPKGGSYTETL